MPDLKISLITVSFNAAATIKSCVTSVINQHYTNVEYIIIDGCSTDDTIALLAAYKDNISILISEPDLGMYDAMNKGIRLATGDIVGILNADDFFSDDDALGAIASAFAASDPDIVYADLDYINNSGLTIRKWRSGLYKHGQFNYGWMPPHPTFYCKRELFDRFGFYSLEYGTAGDYELMLRFMHINRAKAKYLSKVLVKMNIGGASNKNYSSRVKGLLFDLKAMSNRGLSFPLVTIILKPLRKLSQYFG